jgi:hypothetical protein
VSVYSTPIAALVARMAYHTGGTGRLLEGYSWHDLPVEHQDGPSDLPAVQLFLPDMQEEYRSARLGDGKLDIRLTVSVARSAGVAALMFAVEEVINASETNHVTGLIDPSLGGTLAKPFDVAVVEPFATGLSLTAQISLACKVRPFERGKR